MLGHRGCRLGVTYPEIYEMQARAIFEAACSLAVAPVPEIMIPLVGTRRELELMKEVVDKAAEAVFAEQGKRIDYLVGTMIELPRAALMACCSLIQSKNPIQPTGYSVPLFLYSL